MATEDGRITRPPELYLHSGQLRYLADRLSQQPTGDGVDENVNDAHLDRRRDLAPT
jgi:hypothetical protein